MSHWILRIAFAVLMAAVAVHAQASAQSAKAAYEHQRLQPSVVADPQPLDLPAGLDTLRSTPVAAPAWTTFGTGLACHTLYTDERELWNYTVSSSASTAVLFHFWTTGAPSDWVDRTTWRYYVDGETEASIQFTAAMAAGVGFGDAKAPWGTDWFGKQAHDGGWYLHFRFPFSKSVRVTGQLPGDLAPGFTAQLYLKLRGAENYPIVFSGFTLPTSARLVQSRLSSVTFAPLQFVPLASIRTGAGLLFAHSLAVSSQAMGFIEGCYHAYRSYTEPYPALVAGTGTEDYFDSAYAFNAGPFNGPVTGLTHQSTVNGTTRLSMYRLHHMDPIFFSGGFRFEWRNGDVFAPNGYKCVTETGPTVAPTENTTVSAYTWAYVW
jgi:hypothetical protein